MVARHGRPPRRGGECAGRGLQQVPDGIQGQPVYKGTYTETLTGAIAAFRAKQAPHIVQVFEVGTATMMAAKGAVYPVFQLMADAKEPFDPKAYLARSRLLLDDRRQAAVDAVQFLDAGALLEQGAVHEGRPRSRQAADDLAGAGRDGQEGCRRRRQVRVHAAMADLDQIENFGAWHNLPFATKDNGFGGLDIELKFNDPLRVKHIQTLADWQQGQDLRLWRPRG